MGEISLIFVLFPIFLYICVVQRIYNILVSFLGESKQGGFSKDTMQYQFNSPWSSEENFGIPDNKYNLEVSLSLGKYHEWVTDYGGNISKLIKRFGTREQLQDYYTIIKELKESKYYDIDLFKDDGSIVYDLEALKLPKTFTKINIKTLRKKKLLDYLTKRHITQDVIDFYNIGYTTWDEDKWQLRDRVIIPSYDVSGELNYWVGRDFSEYKKKIKYMNCDADKKKIIFTESNIQWDADIWLCEGIFDSLVHPNVIPLMGKILLKDSELYLKLKEKANANIIICLDSDTNIDETKRIYNLLNTGRLKGKIWYIRLGEKDIPYKDFAEIYESEGKTGIIKTFKNKKQFSEFELLI